LNGQEVATGNSGGLLTKEPGEPLCIGKDETTAVGDYDLPFAFKGSITAVVMNGKAQK
jgi:hypothetical protein